MRDCNHCKNVTEIDVIDAKDLSAHTFEDKYAYSGRPLLIKNAANNWKAMVAFHFEFFRDLQNAQFMNDDVEEVNFGECQFFGNNGPFNNLQVHIYMLVIFAQFL